ncbi:MAG: hypothetical protein ABSB18_00745 [Candidatus Omnitrophota bacterium]
MRKNLEIKSKFTKFITFNQNNAFFDYEAVNTKDSNNFYFIDKDKQIACFITGNIYAYEEKRLEIMQGINIAKMIAYRYQEKSLMDSLRYFRGQFNIILITKRQLLLINDTLGLSPMYTYRIKEGFLFSNQAEPIVWMNEDNRIDYSSIAEFLVYGFVPNGKTFIRGLNNQPPGTIIRIDKTKLSVNKYANFKSMKGKKAIQRQKIKITNEVFNEGVRIRVNKGRVFSELSGGWDTRFVLGNLMKLDKEVSLFTENLCEEDVIISKKIAKKMKLDHILRNPLMVNSGNPVTDTLRFRLRQVIPDNNLNNISNKKLEYLTKVKFFTSPKFTGLFGTEFLGYLPGWFTRRINLEFVPAAKGIFTPHFSARLYRGKSRKPFPGFTMSSNFSKRIHLFLTQIGRSYLNMLYDGSWERPTYFFSYLYLHPFTDSKFLSLLCTLDYDQDMHYRLYTRIYKKYYSEYLNIPWTDERYRIRNNLKKQLSGFPFRKQGRMI